MSLHSRNLLYIHTAVLLFGLAGLFGDQRILDLAPVALVFWRVTFASAVLLLAGLVRRDILRLASWYSLLPFAVLGAMLAVHWTMFFQAVQASNVALALITYATFPVFVAFLEPLFFRERLHLVDVVRAALVVAGVAILQPRFQWDDRVTPGILWGIGSALTFALLALLNRRLVREHSSLTLALYQDLFAAAALLPFVFAGDRTLTVFEVLLLAVLGIFCTAVAHSLFIAGMNGVSARTASTIACLEPVYGVLLMILCFGEAPTLRTVLGGIVIVGVAIHATMRAGNREKGVGKG